MELMVINETPINQKRLTRSIITFLPLRPFFTTRLFFTSYTAASFWSLVTIDSPPPPPMGINYSESMGEILEFQGGFDFGYCLGYGLAGGLGEVSSSLSLQSIRILMVFYFLGFICAYLSMASKRNSSCLGGYFFSQCFYYCLCFFLPFLGDSSSSSFLFFLEMIMTSLLSYLGRLFLSLSSCWAERSDSWMAILRYSSQSSLSKRVCFCLSLGVYLGWGVYFLPFFIRSLSARQALYAFSNYSLSLFIWPNLSLVLLSSHFEVTVLLLNPRKFYILTSEVFCCFLG